MRTTSMRMVGGLTLLLFCMFVFVPQGLAATNKSTEKAPDGAAMDGGPRSSGEMAKEEGVGKIEVAQSASEMAKKKKFPWLIVAAAVVVGAVVVYFFVLNKKNTLTVILGEGAQGTPAAGAVKYKKNESVPYQYTLAPAFKDLVVKLDGSPVSASGSVKMDKSHTLEATATKGASIHVTTTPAGAQVWLDGVKTSWVTPYILFFDSPGAHDIMLRLDGYKDHAATAQAAMGVETPLNVTLAAGHHEDFTIAPSLLWTPQTAADWTVHDGNYAFVGRYFLTTWNLLKHSWDSASYTVSAKFLRHYGQLYAAQGILLLTDANTLSDSRGYGFAFDANGAYETFRSDGIDMITDEGPWAWIQEWTEHYAIAYGLDAWNALKVVKNGSSYAFYINDILVNSFTDTTYDPRCAGIWIATIDMHTEQSFDYFYVDLGATAGVPRGKTVVPIQSMRGSIFKRQ